MAFLKYLLQYTPDLYKKINILMGKFHDFFRDFFSNVKFGWVVILQTPSSVQKYHKVNQS